MTYIKKIVMQGFKSFARRTEIPFDKGINVIVGPNGSGKSNISDALCFVLGRLSIKSLRAAKAKNLIFMGSKFIKPAKEACVEIVFDNSDRTFSIERDEISIERKVRRDGQSIYKINGETKTRNEIIELLAQAGIDPYGFNIILQGEIQSIVMAHPEERRKIIEDVAGISIYETRKEKSLKELEKTDEKLKEINAVLRERTAYLRNLERERAQALKYKELESLLKKIKASIIKKKIDEKERELNSILKSIEEKTHEKEKIREKAEKIKKEIEALGEKINQINRHIQETSGIEQETLHNQIGNLKAEIEGHKVRKENYENRKEEIERRIAKINEQIPEIKREIEELREKSPQVAKKANELKKKKEELALIEEERKKVLTIKSELNSIKERINDKEKQVAKTSAESDLILKQIEELSKNLSYKNEEECLKTINSLKNLLKEKKKELETIENESLKNEKQISVLEFDINRIEKIKNDVKEIDVCPLCQSKITENHREHVVSESNNKIKICEERIYALKDEIGRLKTRKNQLIEEIKSNEEKTSNSEIELIKQKTIREKKEHLKRIVDEEKALKEEIISLLLKRKELENKTIDLSEIEARYHAKIMEIEEISSRTEEDIDNTLLHKEREIEQMQHIIKMSNKDIEEIENNINEISKNLDRKIALLEEKEEQEKKLNEKFKKMFEEMDMMQKELQERSVIFSETQNNMRAIDDQINFLRIGKAKIDAEKEALGMEMSEFVGVELIKATIETLQERLAKTQQALSEIGTINMRALEIYDEMKKEYDSIQEKVNILEKEKAEIMQVIAEIDRKKKITFMRTFKSINELFTRNFSKLSTKGEAFLDIENKENIFDGGINILVKKAKGKYFDVTSLSGGEKVLVALSLLFAIQEHKPYHFYIFDEIDAALDKRNSERLAALLNQYMQSGQYVVVTHNDAIIMNSNLLYGVTMHDDVSKILSIKLEDKEEIKKYNVQNAVQKETREDENEIGFDDEWNLNNVGINNNINVAEAEKITNKIASSVENTNLEKRG
ncbi:MAG: chromosome segregation protein SMC [Candidatus Pacearchaeota archaeon]|nr:chromosome segregation protein SMC [Candidatus Pacearchaeota archaeon]